MNLYSSVDLARKSKCYTILILPHNIHWHFVLLGYLLQVHLFVTSLTKKREQLQITKGVMGSGGRGGRAEGSVAGADPNQERAQPCHTEEQKAGIRHVAGHGPAES